MTDTPQPGAADAAPVVIDASVLKPSLTALIRWLMHALGVWLITRGLAPGQADALEPILTGLALSGGALLWSVLQKRWVSFRVRLAARTEPERVRLK